MRIIKTLIAIANSLANLSCMYAELNKRVCALEEKKPEAVEAAAPDMSEQQFQKGLESILNYTAGKVTNEKDE